MLQVPCYQITETAMSEIARSQSHGTEQRNAGGFDGGEGRRGREAQKAKCPPFSTYLMMYPQLCSLEFEIFNKTSSYSNPHYFHGRLLA